MKLIKNKTTTPFLAEDDNWPTADILTQPYDKIPNLQYLWKTADKYPQMKPNWHLVWES